jgi:gamma-glutamyl hercynylcysteine S-oxide hydrolase
MCRLLAYWGPPVSVPELIVDPAHSLLVQCTDSRLQTSGHENPDGWGLAWYPAPAPALLDDEVPARYRSADPMPVDSAGLARLADLRAGRFVAHVRHKSPGSPTEVAGNAPFVRGALAFAHNGFVAGYRDGRRQQLRARLSPEVRASIQGDADSEVLFGLVLDRLGAGDDLAEAVAAVVTDVADVAVPEDDPRPAEQRGGKFNIVLTDGRQLVATRWGNSLYLRRDVPAPGAVIVASEPYDDDADWQEVPDHTLVRVTAAAVQLDHLGPTPLEVHP